MAKQNKNLLNWLTPKCSTDSTENYSNNTTSQIVDVRSDAYIKTISFSKISK